MAIARLGFDSLSALVLAATAAIGAYLPVFLAAVHRRRGGVGRSLTFVLLNMFSAGVMVSAGFCHLLGEALKLMPQAGAGYGTHGTAVKSTEPPPQLHGPQPTCAPSPRRSLPQNQQFPMAPFLCGLGFLLTLVADRFAHQASGAGGSCHAAGDARGELGTAVAAGVPGEVGPVAALAGIDLEKGRYVSKTSLDEECTRLIHSTSSVDSGRTDANGSSKLPPYARGAGALAMAAAPVNGMLEADGDPGGLRLMAHGLANGSGSMQHRHLQGPEAPGGTLELEQDGAQGAEGLGGSLAAGPPRLAGGGEAGSGSGGGGARARGLLAQRGARARVSFITGQLQWIPLV